MHLKTVRNQKLLTGYGVAEMLWDHEDIFVNEEDFVVGA